MIAPIPLLKATISTLEEDRLSRKKFSYNSRLVFFPYGTSNKPTQSQPHLTKVKSVVDKRAHQSHTWTRDDALPHASV